MFLGQLPVKGDRSCLGPTAGGGVMWTLKWDSLAGRRKEPSYIFSELFAPYHRQSPKERAWCRGSYDTQSCKPSAEVPVPTHRPFVTARVMGSTTAGYFTRLSFVSVQTRVYEAAQQGWGPFYFTAISSGLFSGATCKTLPQVSRSHTPLYI